MDNKFQVFCSLVKEQFTYGAEKYKADNQKEVTDILCDDFGFPGLFWTLGKYCKRFGNQKRERDVLKIACYMYIVWLKYGYHVYEWGSDGLMNTNLEMKKQNWEKFIAEHERWAEDGKGTTQYERSIDDVYQEIKLFYQIVFDQPLSRINKTAFVRIHWVFALCYNVWFGEFAGNYSEIVPVKKDEKR
jgi:hypothetical protein